MIDVKYLLSDEEMSQFIRRGYHVLRNKLPDSLHQKVMEKINYSFNQEGNPGNNILPRVPEIQKFFDTLEVKGALTSVLGPGYYMHPHRHCHYNSPGNQKPGGGGWHKDGYWSSMRSHRPWWVMIFYYTHDITEEMGPTAIMPGTQYYENYPGDDHEVLLPTGKAGTMALVHFDMWHQASVNTSASDRYMLKFQFVRLEAPAYPSWNNVVQEMPDPEKDVFPHRNLWRNIWQWLRAEAPQRQQHSKSEIDPELLKQYLFKLKDESPDVRGRAADEIGLRGLAAPGLTLELANLLEDKDERVALNASYALGNLGKAGIEHLLNCMKDGDLAAGALRAAYGIQTAGAVAVTGLIPMLNQQNDQRRALAAFSLGMLGADAAAAVSVLISKLQDESEWARRNVVEALGLIAQPAEQIVPALAESLQQSLTEDHSFSGNPTEMYVVGQQYIHNKVGYTSTLSLLRTARPEDAELILPVLKMALESEDRYVRAYASEVLTNLRTEECIDLLIQHFRSARWCSDTNKSSTF